MDHSSVVESTQRSYLNKSKDNIMKNITVSQKLWVFRFFSIRISVLF